MNVRHCIPVCILREEGTQIDCDKDKSKKVSIAARGNFVALLNAVGVHVRICYL